jgi:hypothetical protein
MTFAVEEVGQILSREARGRVLISPERRKSLLGEYDPSHWLQSRRRQRGREKLLLKADANTAAGQSTGGWIEAVVEEGSAPRVPARSLRIYFAGGAYAQISSAGEAALAAELLGRLGAKR